MSRTRIEHARPHGAVRAAAYPPVGEQLDAIYKLAAMLARAGMELPPETRAWIAQVDAVKRRYPKPQ